MLQKKQMKLEDIKSEFENLNTLGGKFEVKYRKQGKDEVVFNYNAITSLEVAKKLGYKFTKRKKDEGVVVKTPTFKQEVRSFIKEQRLLNGNIQKFIKSQMEFNKDQKEFNEVQKEFNAKQDENWKDQKEFNAKQDENWKDQKEFNAKQDENWKDQKEFNKAISKHTKFDSNKS